MQTFVCVVRRNMLSAVKVGIPLVGAWDNQWDNVQSLLFGV